MQAGTPSPAAVSPSTSLLTRNPLPLSAYQEGQVRDIYYARVRGICGAEIKEFAECARNRTVSATWACRAERRSMNTCMVLNATPEQQDAARQEWFQQKMEKRRKDQAAEDAGQKAVGTKGAKK